MTVKLTKFGYICKWQNVISLPRKTSDEAVFTIVKIYYGAKTV